MAGSMSPKRAQRHDGVRAEGWRVFIAYLICEVGGAPIESGCSRGIGWVSYKKQQVIPAITVPFLC